MSSQSQPKLEVFQVSLTIERQWVKEVIRAVLSTILFQRVLGNFRPRSMEVCGVTFPVPADSDVEALINIQVDALSRALDQSSTTSSGTPKPSRLFLALYPTPKAPRAPLPTPKVRAPPLATALGWFSASTKAFVGGEEESNSTQDDEEEFGKVWEGWVVEVEMVSESRRGPAGAAEEKLRSQLNHFLLRTIVFSEKTSHVPPITSAEVQPFGFQILINPSSPPFPIPKAIIQAPSALPLLHRALIKSYRPVNN